MNMKHRFGNVAWVLLLCVVLVPIRLYAAQELSIGQSENVYLNPSLPSGAWITSASWSTDVIGLECSYGGEWGTMVTAYGYWENIATLTCLYTYSYYGADNKLHVSHGNECYYFTCKGYPISISATTLTLDPDKTATLSFSISGASIGQIPAKWISSNETVATVASSGTYTATVRAKQPGNCVITCYSYMGKPVTCSVKVNSVQPTSISLSPSEATVTVDKTVSIEYAFTPSYATSSVTWKSLNSSIATVSNYGTVKGVKAGKTTIIATTANGLTARCAITVTDKYVNPRGPVSTYLEGTGTSSNPYKIKSAADLRYLADKVNSGTNFSGKYFLQTKDISINTTDHNSESFKSGEIWIPIGDQGKPFNGSYDGGNKTISGIYITDENELDEITSRKALGLFGYIGIDAKILNVVVSNSLYDITNNGIIQYLSALVGLVYGGSEVNGSRTNNAIIKNCHVKETIMRGHDVCVSGIGGSSYSKSDGITIDKCSNSASIFGGDRAMVAGIIVNNYSGYGVKQISNCVNAGNIVIPNTAYAAGIAYEPTCPIFNNCNMGNIEVVYGEYSNSPCISGIAWNLIYGSSVAIEHCVNYGNLSGKSVVAILYDYYRYGGKGNLINNFYEESAPLFKAYSVQITLQNNRECTKKELTSDAILSELNSNLKSGWCRWVKGKDGYPTLDYYAEVAGIDDVAVDDTSHDIDFALPFEVYNLSGMALGNAIDDLPAGIYVIRQGCKVKKIAVK